MDTIVPAGDPAAVILYSELTYAQAIRYTTAMKLAAVGLSKDDPSNFVQLFEDTADKSGEKILYELIYNPFGPGIAGDNVIAGNEVPLTYDQDALYINQLRQSMLLKGMMSQQRVPFSLRDKARNGESNWMRTMIEYGLMNQAAGNSSSAALPYVGSTGSDSGQYNYCGMQAPLEPTSDHWIFPAGATSETTVGTDAKYSFTLDLIPDYVALAQGNFSTPIKPVVINDLEIPGIGFLNHLQVKDLKKQFDAGQWGNIMAAAMQGGQVAGNPIFTGMLGIFDGVPLHQNTYLPWGDGVNSNLVLDPATKTRVGAPNSLYGGANGTLGYATQYIGRGVFLGAQAIAMAVGMADGTPDNPLRVKWVEEPLDANNQLRITCGMIFGFHKTQFAGSDYGLVTFSTWVSST